MASNLRLILDGSAEGTTTEILVLQQVMANASSYFRAMLSPGRFAEGESAQKKDMLEISLPEVDARAMQIVCDIFHLRSKMVPVQTLSSDDLANVAILVDKFDCLEAVQPWAQRWMEQSHLVEEMGAVGRMSLEERAKWACICHILGPADQAQLYVQHLTLYMAGKDLAYDRLSYLDYIPQSIVGDIASKRSEIADKFRHITTELVQQLQGGQSCKLLTTRVEALSFDEEPFHCSSVLLGNAQLAVRCTIGDVSETAAWDGSIADMHQQMLKLAKKLTGPLFIARASGRKTFRRHEACSGVTSFEKQIEQIIIEVDPREFGTDGLLPRTITLNPDRALEEMH